MIVALPQFIGTIGFEKAGGIVMIDGAVVIVLDR